MGRNRTSANLQSLKADDPASAPTLPGHGPNIPQQETAMDSQSNTTDAAPAARPAMDRRRIVNPAIDLLHDARLLSMLARNLAENELKEDPKAPGLTYPLNGDQAEMITYVTIKTEEAILKVKRYLEGAL